MNAARNEAGFSLTELLVAMLVTMIVSGAVFTLLNAGQGAFRRQPELTERQQNIRLAMDLIQRDIETAGAGMDPFEQAFSAGDGVGDTAPFLDGAGPAGPNGQNTDILEVLGADGTCNETPASTAVPPAAPNFNTAFGVPECMTTQPLAAIAGTLGTDTVFWGKWGGNLNPGDVTVLFPPGVQPAKSDIQRIGGGFPAGPSRVMAVQLARYAIQLDPANQVPSLWRSGQGGLDQAGARTAVGDPNGGWQLIARGVEDLQVRYRRAGGAFAPSPMVATNPDFTTLTDAVEITLWARTLAPNLQGQTMRGGISAVHGSLTSVTSPRAALQALHGAPPGAIKWQ